MSNEVVNATKVEELQSSESKTEIVNESKEQLYEIPLPAEFEEASIIEHDLGRGLKLNFFQFEDNTVGYTVKEEPHEENLALKSEIEKLYLRISELSNELQAEKSAKAEESTGIKVIRAAKSSREGNVVGYATIDIAGIRLRNIKVVKSIHTPGTFFISSPQIFSKKDSRYYCQYGIQDKKLHEEASKIVINAVMNASMPINHAAQAAPATNPATVPTVAQKQPDDLELALAVPAIEKALFDPNVAQYGGNPILKSRKGNARGAIVGQYSFWTQNAITGSEWAIRALKGEKIMWVFKNGNFYARILNGKFEVLPQNIAK